MTETSSETPLLQPAEIQGQEGEKKEELRKTGKPSSSLSTELAAEGRALVEEAKEAGKKKIEKSRGWLEKLKGKLTQKLNKILDTLTQKGVPLLKFAGATTGFLAEFLGPATLWLPKISLVAAGYGLDRLGRRRPNSRFSRLVKALGEGVWKGGVMGAVSQLVVDNLLPSVTGGTDTLVKPTQALSSDLEKRTGGVISSLVNGAEEIAKTVSASPPVTLTQETVVQIGQALPTLVQEGVSQTEMIRSDLTDFLKTPIGRISGAVGLGALTYKFLKKIGLYKTPK